MSFSNCYDIPRNTSSGLHCCYSVNYVLSVYLTNNDTELEQELYFLTLNLLCVMISASPLMLLALMCQVNSFLHRPCFC